MNILYHKSVVAVIFLTFSIQCFGESKAFLIKSWKKHVEPIKDGYIVISYQERMHSLHHGEKPWSTLEYARQGKYTVGIEKFLLSSESKDNTGKTYKSKAELTEKGVFLLDYGDESFKNLDLNNSIEYKLSTAKYSPIFLLDLFYRIQDGISVKNENGFSKVTAKIGINKVSILINKNNFSVESIEVLSDHELYGDISTIYSYKDYSSAGNLPVEIPFSVKVLKYEGRVVDEIKLKDARVASGYQTVFQDKLIGAELIEENNVAGEYIEVERYSDNLYLLKMPHTDSMSVAVEFNNFFMVIEAPLNSRNGELIIEAVRKIDKDKPIKYFAFGHHHPHYIGGVRPFVGIGANIITTKWNDKYAKAIIGAKRTLNPDYLENNSVNPKVIMLESEKHVISDGNYDVEIFHLGEKSRHTQDYLIFYFPKDKALFEGDLVWIRENGEYSRVPESHHGLVDAIESLGWDVNTILQSWPLNKYSMKSKISFQEVKDTIKK